MGWYGNARHPARDPAAPDAVGPARGSNSCTPVALVHGPSLQSIGQIASLGLAVNTASPMSRGSRVWGGVEGFGVHRFNARLAADPSSPTAGAISPVQTPQTARYGIGVGPSQAGGSSYPNTGAVADAGLQSVATMSMGQLGAFGYGG